MFSRSKKNSKSGKKLVVRPATVSIMGPEKSNLKPLDLSKAKITIVAPESKFNIAVKEEKEEEDE
jgi:hypothetical protein